MLQNLIDKATYEAIYQWNRDEGYKYLMFERMDQIKKADLLDFFIVKLFIPFLNDYSIRRTLPARKENIQAFLQHMYDRGYFDEIKNGNIKVIDAFSASALEDFTNNQTKSLISKMAFLINPNDFTLYDTMAKEGIWRFYKNRNLPKNLSQSEVRIEYSKQTNFLRKELDSYEFFHNESQNLLEFLESQGCLRNADRLLGIFKGTLAFNHFKNNKISYKLRIIDKFLWIIGQIETDRDIKSEKYPEFYKKFELDFWESK